MTDSPKVETVKDNGGKNQWGKHGLRFVDGKKLTVNKKALGYGLIGLFTLVCIIQFTVGLEDSTTTKPNPIAFEAGEAKQISLPEAQPEDVRIPSQGAKKSAAVRRYSGPQVLSRPRNLKKIPPGTMGEAVLVTGASNGLVRAKLTSAISVGGATELEPGVLLVGQGSSSTDRLMVQFSQAVFRDGSMGDINAHACDMEDRIVGLQGSNVATKALNIVGSIGLGFVGGLAEGLQETQGQQGTVVRPPTLKNGLLNATSRTALEQSRNLMNDLQSKKPLIEVPSGKKICVIFGGAR